MVFHLQFSSISFWNLWIDYPHALLFFFFFFFFSFIHISSHTPFFNLLDDHGYCDDFTDFLMPIPLDQFFFLYYLPYRPLFTSSKTFFCLFNTFTFLLSSGVLWPLGLVILEPHTPTSFFFPCSVASNFMTKSELESRCLILSDYATCVRSRFVTRSVLSIECFLSGCAAVASTLPNLE